MIPHLFCANPNCGKQISGVGYASWKYKGHICQKCEDEDNKKASTVRAPFVEPVAPKILTYERKGV